MNLLKDTLFVCLDNIRYNMHCFMYIKLFYCSYEYSHSKDRMWRKTRSRHRGNACVGVDPNRNWGYHWAGQGASGDPCDETFYGPKAFSEPETDAIQKFIMARKHYMKVSISFLTVS